MAGALRKTMVYLGLAEDQGRYDDDYDEAYDDHVEQADHHEHAPERAERRGAEVTHLPTRHSVAHVVSSPEVGGLSRITTIHPRTYNEAKTVGENFRDGIPVIMNLSELEDGEDKRLVDFAAGLIFGLRGNFERISSKVFLLCPHNLVVGPEDKERIASGGFFNQS